LNSGSSGEEQFPQDFFYPVSSMHDHGAARQCSPDCRDWQVFDGVSVEKEVPLKIKMFFPLFQFSLDSFKCDAGMILVKAAIDFG